MDVYRKNLQSIPLSFPDQNIGRRKTVQDKQKHIIAQLDTIFFKGDVVSISFSLQTLKEPSMWKIFASICK